MDTGPTFSGTLVHPGGPTIKGLAIRLGNQKEATVCFDTELLRYSCGWTGGFLKFNPARYGLIGPPSLDGSVQFTSPKQPGVTASDTFVDQRPHPPWGPLPPEAAHYQGLSLHGPRVVLHYTVGTTQVLESPWAESTANGTIFTREFLIHPSDQTLKLLLSDEKTVCRLIGDPQGTEVTQSQNGSHVLVIPRRNDRISVKVALWNGESPHQAALETTWKKSAPAQDVHIWTEPGPARWGAPLLTKGRVAASSPENSGQPFVIDTLTIPFQNPYHALMFTSGLDFFANGDAAVCTAHGDVWLVGGIDRDLKQITWKRFATGLFQPLGLKIIKSPENQRELIYVLGRDQITRLHDLNADGEADFYQNFNNAGQATTNSHEFATCLETDSQGNFYYLRGDSGSQTQHDGCLLRVSPDGSRHDVFATGFRNANGLGIGPDDMITVAPQEGTWTPGSAIFSVKQGGFYGAMQSHHRPTPPTTFEPPICWIPRQQDNSSGGQVWVPRGTWKPLEGQLLHFSFGTCKMFLTVREQAGDLTQGGTVAFPLQFDSGVMRARFHPLDGQLYVTGLKGWVSSAVQDGCLQRVRYTGQAVDFPVAMKTFSNGIALTFTSALAESDAEDPDNFSIEQWNYQWSGNYGSADYRVSQPNQTGHDPVTVVSSTLLTDRRTVFLEIPNLKPAMQTAISYTLLNSKQQPIQQTFNATIHRVGSDPQPAPLVRKARSGQLPPEIESVLRPGLIFKTEFLESDVPPRWSVSRLAAFATDPGDKSQTSRIRKLTWSGYLKLPQKSQYHFLFSKQEELMLDGQTVPAETPILLGRGYHRLELVSLAPLKSSANASLSIRLRWKADGFPLETIPPSALFHASDKAELKQAQAVAEGRHLFHWYGCRNCHERDSDAAKNKLMETSHKSGPALDQIQGRLNPSWMAAWIENPRQLRPQALMPDLFHAADTNPETSEPIAADQKTIADLVAFLNRTPSDKPRTMPSSEPDETFAAEGRQLYQALGCMGCHRLTAPQEPDDYHRISLFHAAVKYQGDYLADFLRKPQRHYPATRMPDFHLTHHEAVSLQIFLRSELQARLPDRPELDAGDADRGAHRFHQLGCRQCHDSAAKQTMPPTMKPYERRPLIAGRTQQVGCLSSSRTGASRTRPDYALSDSERQALQAYLQQDMIESDRSSDESDFKRDTAQLMRRLNCAACHSRDGQNSPLGEIVAEEGDGLPAEAIPHLTWAGEKLRPDWIKQLLEGTLDYKTRPLLKARMPAFPAYSFLSEGLAKEHGVIEPVSSQAAEAVPASDAEVELGRQLTLKTQGLDCRQCHGVGAEQPMGDKATLISPGINFSITAERMNFNFLPQLMLNPPRYDPSTRMPVFSVDGKTTAAKGILNGDAEKQFQALRKYLMSIPTLKSVPH